MMPSQVQRLRMHRLRSPGTVGQWTAVLGVLLIMGPLVQSVAPCDGPAASDSEAVRASVTPGAQWTCAKVAAATMVRAVSSERAPVSLDGSAGEPFFEPAVTAFPPLFLERPRRVSSPPLSSALAALRAVVLQI